MGRSIKVIDLSLVSDPGQSGMQYSGAGPVSRAKQDSNGTPAREAGKQNTAADGATGLEQVQHITPIIGTPISRFCGGLFPMITVWGFADSAFQIGLYKAREVGASETHRVGTDARVRVHTRTHKLAQHLHTHTHITSTASPHTHYTMSHD